MIVEAGNYLVRIENNSIEVLPTHRARFKDVQQATFAEAHMLRPNYVRDIAVRRIRFTGIIYLIHFHRPYKHARHYLGFTKDLDERMLAHSAGRGARLMQVIEEAGIGWHISRIWYGDRYEERRLKKWHDSPKLCPTCQKERIRV